jgi:hypothetical protein
MILEYTINDPPREFVELSLTATFAVDYNGDQARYKDLPSKN